VFVTTLFSADFDDVGVAAAAADDGDDDDSDDDDDTDDDDDDDVLSRDPTGPTARGSTALQLKVERCP